MKYPNRRYGNPNELAYYVQGIPLQLVAERLRRDERTLRNYLTGREKMPWWIPEIIRLQNLEHEARMRQMGMKPMALRLGLVTPSATLYEFPAQAVHVYEPPAPAPYVCEDTLPLFATG